MPGICLNATWSLVESLEHALPWMKVSCVWKSGLLWQGSKEWGPLQCRLDDHTLILGHYPPRDFHIRIYALIWEYEVPWRPIKESSGGSNERRLAALAPKSDMIYCAGPAKRQG